MKLEIAVDSLTSALIAEANGADRIELCANLNIGGTTPSIGLIKEVRRQFKKEIYVMIRPRTGDFCYSDDEFHTMKADIIALQKLNIEGIVVGILLPDGTVDKQRMAELITIARPMKITFHRAIDRCCNLQSALKDLITLGIDRVLTSGGANSAYEGITLIKELVNIANDKIKVMAGAGINLDNIEEIISETNVHEIHLSARHKIPSQMTYQNKAITTKEDQDLVGYTTIADGKLIQNLSKIIKKHT